MTEQEAIDLAESRFWERMAPRDRFIFQLYEPRLCMPFDVFHQSAQEALGRPVWTHEFAFPENLKAELNGNGEAPTFEEICELIPAEKRIVIEVEDREPWQGEP